MRWRLVMYLTTERWLAPVTEGDPPKLTGGLELPEGAKIHSIQPVATERHRLHESATEDVVTGWAIFVAVPVDEEEIST